VDLIGFDDTSFQPQNSSDPQLVNKDERSIRDTSHRHNGADAPKLNMLDMVGLIEVVSAAPTLVPGNMFDQIKIYSNGGTRRLYVYVTDSAGSGAWRYTALT
jgi:hypothetical protein